MNEKDANLCLAVFMLGVVIGMIIVGVFAYYENLTLADAVCHSYGYDHATRFVMTTLNFKFNIETIICSSYGREYKVI